MPEPNPLYPISSLSESDRALFFHALERVKIALGNDRPRTVKIMAFVLEGNAKKIVNASLRGVREICKPLRGT